MQHRLVAALAVVTLIAVACSGSPEAPDGSALDPSAAEPTTTTAPTTTTTTVVAARGECGLHGAYPQPWPDRPRYEVSLEIDPEAGFVRGDMTVEFEPPEPTDRLVFRLWANMPRVGSGGGRLEITSVNLDGRSVETGYEDGGAGPGTPGTIFNVFSDFEPGRPVEVALAFELVMPGAINERVAKVGSSLRLGSIIPLLAWVRGHGWHTSPAVSNFSEAVASEVADYDVRVSVPDGFTVLATGEEIELGRFSAPAVRDWAATVGRLHVVEGTAQQGATRVLVGVAEGVALDADAVLADTIDALDDFAARYGPYPRPVVSVGVTAALTGGIEFPQHLFFGAEASRRSLIHEVAHLWFYGLVGNDQYAHPWLDEGLTTYAESRFLGTTDALRRQQIPAVGRHRLGESHTFWQQHPSAFFRSVYTQGVQALGGVADTVGGFDVIDCALRRYVLENAFSVATPDDLVAAIEAQTGVDPRPVLERYGAL